MTDPIAETAYGKVSGMTEGGVSAFKGIPYGAPTRGQNRFTVRSVAMERTMGILPRIRPLL